MGTRGLQTVLRLLGLGWYVVISIVGFGYGGYLLDNALGINPFLTLVGIAAGLVVAIAGVYRMLIVFVIKNDKTDSGVE